MRRSKEEELAIWNAETRREDFRRRNWKRTRRLAVLPVSMLLGGLVADVGYAARTAAVLLWAAAAISGALMLLLHFNRRFFLDQPGRSGPETSAE